MWTEKGTKAVEAPPAAWLRSYPQSFKFDLLVRSLEAAAKKKAALRDEADALAFSRGELHVVPAQQPLLRIAGPRELVLADHHLRR